ncbi:type II toxin-antitoxin system HicB family antitoxin [Niveispirillum sp. KHB5.9]|uniref:type II toxin-antitoxin system HicB family antitoxin n=1 Tax=Niveispirillum sp. KHB5.9 TaxID=3400269 RepID=UPI003A846214
MEEALIRRYHINLFWADEDECWIADVPDLRFCSAHGATPEEAAHEITIAMTAWLESALDRGRMLPAPTYRPQSAA